MPLACRTCRLKMCVSCPTQSSTMSSSGTVRAEDTKAFGLRSLELLMSLEATCPAQPSERSSAESRSFSLCGWPLRPYLVTATPCLSRRMPSSAVAERTEFVGCTTIPVPRPRTRAGAEAAAGGAAPAPMGKDQSTSSTAGCWSDDRRRDTRLARWRLMFVWEGVRSCCLQVPGPLGCKPRTND